MLSTKLQDFHITLPPTQDDLPCDDGVPMETQRHKLQMELLIDSLLPWLDAREDGGVTTTWLRWSQCDGTLLLTAEEIAVQSAEEAEIRAEEAQNQVTQIVQRLLQTGMEVSQVAEITGLAIAQVTAVANRSAD